ncbi:MAG: hypothetical protein LKE89_06260 [Lactobacillaceae bacterium]|nr:hypothetical protein [Lactobacillaceae bacterium]
MTKFKIGDVVQLPQKTWQQITAVVIYYDTKADRYLVRVGASQQIYFRLNELTRYSAKIN